MDQIKYKQNFKKFPSRWHLYKFLGEELKDFNFNKSALLAPYCFVDGKGNFHRCPTFVHFINTLNDKFGGFFDVRASRQIGQQILLIMNDKPEILAGVTSVVVEGAFADKKEVAEIVEEPTVFEDTTSEKEKHPMADEVDWDLIETFSKKSIKAAKDSLEEYAFKFGVDLKKNKSFDNMLKDFKEYLGL